MSPVIAVLAACSGDPVTINPGELGRIMDKDGLKPQIYEAGQKRLENCWSSWGEVCQKMSVLSVAKVTRGLTIERAFLPLSDIPLNDIQMDIQFKVKDDEISKNYVWNTVRAKRHEMNSNILSVSSDAIFDALIKGPAASITIELLKLYDIDQILSGAKIISDAALVAINKELEDVGVEVTRIDFPNGLGTPPEIVLEAKERLYAVEADKARQLAEIEAQLVIEKKRQTVQRVRAANNIEIMKKVHNETGIDPAVYNSQQVAETFADNRVPLGWGTAVVPHHPQTKK